MIMTPRRTALGLAVTLTLLALFGIADRLQPPTLQKVRIKSLGDVHSIYRHGRVRGLRVYTATSQRLVVITARKKLPVLLSGKEIVFETTPFLGFSAGVQCDDVRLEDARPWWLSLIMGLVGGLLLIYNPWIDDRPPLSDGTVNVDWGEFGPPEKPAPLPAPIPKEPPRWRQSDFWWLATMIVMWLMCVFVPMVGFLRV